MMLCSVTFAMLYGNCVMIDHIFAVGGFFTGGFSKQDRRLDKRGKRLCAKSVRFFLHASECAIVEGNEKVPR